MFSGIIQTVGSVRDVIPFEQGRKIVVFSNLDKTGLKIGDSIAIDGCCLTLTQLNGNEKTFYISYDTLKKTSLAMLCKGSLVNLESSLKVGHSIGGHFVSGHVDETARVIEIENIGADRKVKIEISHYGKNFVVQRGSICINGVSLTVAQIIGNVVTLNIIPHTLESTTLKYLNKTTNFVVNVEFDGIAKNVYKTVKNFLTR
jgi:riboflavin synthase